MSPLTLDEKISRFSGFSEIKCNITKPIHMSSLDMKFKPLTLITGLNNSGKSFLNKLMWASTTFFNMKLVEKVTGLKDTAKSDIEIFQFILDKTFIDNDIEGTIEYRSRDELLNVAFYSLLFTMENGKLTNLDFSWPDDAQPMGQITYLSKDARDFNFIDRYTKTKKILGITTIESWDNIEKLAEWFRLYDIFAIETTIPKFKMVKSILDTASKVSKELVDEIGIKDIEFDDSDGSLNYYDENNNKRNIRSLGAGSQSILMMILSSIPVNS